MDLREKSTGVSGRRRPNAGRGRGVLALLEKDTNLRAAGSLSDQLREQVEIERINSRIAEYKKMMEEILQSMSPERVVSEEFSSSSSSSDERESRGGRPKYQYSVKENPERFKWVAPGLRREEREPTTSSPVKLIWSQEEEEEEEEEEEKENTNQINNNIDAIKNRTENQDSGIEVDSVTNKNLVYEYTNTKKCMETQEQTKQSYQQEEDSCSTMSDTGTECSSYSGDDESGQWTNEEESFSDSSNSSDSIHKSVKRSSVPTAGCVDSESTSCSASNSETESDKVHSSISVQNQLEDTRGRQNERLYHDQFGRMNTASHQSAHTNNNHRSNPSPASPLSKRAYKSKKPVKNASQLYNWKTKKVELVDRRGKKLKSKAVVETQQSPKKSFKTIHKYSIEAFPKLQTTSNNDNNRRISHQESTPSYSQMASKPSENAPFPSKSLLLKFKG